MTDRPAPTIALVAPPHGDRELGDRSDDELIALAAAGVRAAFAMLTSRHIDAVRRYCSKWMGSVAEGDDLAQEVFLDLWRARRRYRTQGRFLGFLFTLVRNRCRSATRSRAPRALPVSIPEALAAQQLDRLLVEERRRRTDQAVARLPPKLREALLLRFGAEIEYPEMAAQLGCPEATVRSRIFHAVARLRSSLSRDEA